MPTIGGKPGNNSAAVMTVMDQLPKAIRQLVHEYGLLIVLRMRDVGYEGDKLRAELETWRQRRQDYLLHD